MATIGCLAFYYNVATKFLKASLFPDWSVKSGEACALAQGTHSQS